MEKPTRSSKRLVILLVTMAFAFCGVCNAREISRYYHNNGVLYIDGEIFTTEVNDSTYLASILSGKSSGRFVEVALRRPYADAEASGITAGANLFGVVDLKERTVLFVDTAKGVGRPVLYPSPDGESVVVSSQPGDAYLIRIASRDTVWSQAEFDLLDVHWSSESVSLLRHITSDSSSLLVVDRDSGNTSLVFGMHSDSIIWRSGAEAFLVNETDVVLLSSVATGKAISMFREGQLSSTHIYPIRLAGLEASPSGLVLYGDLGNSNWADSVGFFIFNTNSMTFDTLFTYKDLEQYVLQSSSDCCSILDGDVALVDGKFLWIFRSLDKSGYLIEFDRISHTFRVFLDLGAVEAPVGGFVRK